MPIKLGEVYVSNFREEVGGCPTISIVCLTAFASFNASSSAACNVSA